MLRKFGHRKTRLDERFKIPNDGMYEYYIPKDCVFRTVKEHRDHWMYCWSYYSDLEHGITNRQCGWACEYSKKYNRSKYMKLIGQYS